MSEEVMNVDVAGILAAIVWDFGGEIAISSQALDQNFAGKGLVPQYIPDRDLFVLRLEDIEENLEEDK